MRESGRDLGRPTSRKKKDTEISRLINALLQIFPRAVVMKELQISQPTLYRWKNGYRTPVAPSILRVGILHHFQSKVTPEVYERLIAAG